MALFNGFSLFFPEVPDDVFAPDFIWKGSYDYKGQKQPVTLTVTSFNATTGKVNVTLTDSSMEFLLSGESCITHPSSASSPAPPSSSSQYLCVSLPFILRVPHVNQSITKWSHAWEWKLTIGSKDGCVSLRWLTNCPLKSHSSPPLLLLLLPPRLFSHLFSSFLSTSFLLSCVSPPYFSLLLFLYHSPTLVLPHLFSHIISRITSLPLPCRSVQAPGGTVNALAVPDESAGPQLFEQDYWWDMGNGRICEYTQDFEAAGQWSFENNQELWLCLLFHCIYLFLFSSVWQTKYYRRWGCNDFGAKNKASPDWIKPIFPHYSFFLILLVLPTKCGKKSKKETVTMSRIAISWLLVCFCLHLFTLAVRQMQRAPCMNHPALIICWISTDTQLTSKGPGATAEQLLFVELKFS